MNVIYTSILNYNENIKKTQIEGEENIKKSLILFNILKVFTSVAFKGCFYYWTLCTAWVLLPLEGLSVDDALFYAV